MLLVFVRAPEPGRVKTRLARDIGREKALDIYLRLAGLAFSAARAWAAAGRPQGPAREVWTCFTPEGGAEGVKDWLGREGIFLAQSGSDLGERMARAMKTAFAGGASKVVLVGTDIPDMTPDHLTQAFGALERTDSVWGPSLDGGYWLTGVSDPALLDGLFSGIPWGTEQVLSTTLGKCRGQGISCTCLSLLQDVDTVGDLKATRFYQRAGEGETGL